MNILSGRQVKNFTEAAEFAFCEAGVEDMSTGILDLFSWITGVDRIDSEADKAIGAAIRSRYGNKTSWRQERWFVPVPKLHYDGTDIPQLIITVTVYLVAVVFATTADDSCWVTLAGTIGKAEKLVIPMLMLNSLMERSLGRFAIVARDAAYTAWNIPGAKPVRLPHDFVSQLSETLEFQSIVSWLLEFGVQGRYVAPLVMGNLYGLAFRDLTRPVPASRQMMNTDDLVSALENMAYRTTEAREMVQRASPSLSADMTLEEAIRLVLQTGKGGNQQ